MMTVKKFLDSMKLRKMLKVNRKFLNSYNEVCKRHSSCDSCALHPYCDKNFMSTVDNVLSMFEICACRELKK